MRTLRFYACLLLLFSVCVPSIAHAQHLPPRINGWGFLAATAGRMIYELTYTNITENGQIFSMTCVPINEPAISSIWMYAAWDKNFTLDPPYFLRPMPDAFRAEFKFADVSRIKEILVEISYGGSGEQSGTPVRQTKLNLSTDWQSVTRAVDPGTGKEFSHICLNFMIHMTDPSQITVFATVRNLTMLFGDKEVMLDSMIKEPTDVSDAGSPEVPSSHRLLQNYPNPFNPSTTVPYALREGGEVDLRIFDLLGREVAVLERSYRAAGTHEAVFDGSHLPSGTYCAVLSVDGRPAGSRKLVLLK